MPVSIDPQVLHIALYLTGIPLLFVVLLCGLMKLADLYNLVFPE